jgi:predicted small integral membrane protein
MNGSLSDATIVSSENPLRPLLSGAVGNFVLRIYPLMLFTTVAAQAISVLLRPRLRGSPAAPATVRLILTSNVAICGLCVILLCAGGGIHGHLLPSGLPRFKFFNYSLLAGSSAAVGILLASYIGDVLEGVSGRKRPPSRIVLIFFVGMVFLDLAQGIGLMLIVNPLTTLYMPAMLIVGELTSSAWLAQRSLSLQRKIRALNDGSRDAVSLHLSAVHRRLVISSVSAFAAMVFRCAI